MGTVKGWACSPQSHPPLPGLLPAHRERGWTLHNPGLRSQTAPGVGRGDQSQSSLGKQPLTKGGTRSPLACLPALIAWPDLHTPPSSPLQHSAAGLTLTQHMALSPRHGWGKRLIGALVASISGGNKCPPPSPKFLHLLKVPQAAELGQGGTQGLNPFNQWRWTDSVRLLPPQTRASLQLRGRTWIRLLRGAAGPKGTAT